MLTGPMLGEYQNWVLDKMREGYKAVVPHKIVNSGRFILLHRLGDCDDCVLASRKTVQALARRDLIRMNERDHIETDYVVAIDD